MKKLIIFIIFFVPLATVHAAQDPTHLADSAVAPDYSSQQTKKTEEYSMIKRIPHAADEEDEKLNIADIIANDPSFSSLMEALDTADLTDLLSGSGPFTFFAPNDAAFAKISPNALQDLLRSENKGKLIEILKYHIIPGRISPNNLKTMKLKSINGKTLEIKVNGNGASVNKAKVIKMDGEASNGIVYTIDNVLMPS